MSKYRKQRQESGEYTHGTYYSYTLGCRCNSCLDAKRKYDAEAHEEALKTEAVKHGTTTAYRYGCRCNECTLAHSESDRARKHRNPNWRNQDSDGFVHGGTYGYSRGCRCNSCITGHKDTVKAWMGTEKGKMSVKHCNALRKARLLKSIPDNADIELIAKIYAGRPNGYDVDHIIPLSKGGQHHQDNLQYLPSSLNSSKHNKITDKYDEYAIDWRIFILPVTTIPNGSRTQESSKDAKSGIRTVI